MKSEFILAFNEICEQRGLPKDEVFEALKTALVSAYRRNTNVSNTQEVVAEIDQRTGEPTVYAEKEVVEDIIDHRTEVLLSEARRAGHTEIELGDTVLIDSTPADFGRIAAQTAKQVLLQRVREAEREQLFEDYSAREGEIVNGTVQSISGQHITIGLGRTEAILPKGQQVGSERYRAHDKIRVFVLEVRRTNRGPQIIVSRNHRNLLRRLLELEVPEIYNGQVDIKSIAREAGARSKVAVVALQPGVDPVGACVGMRGVRIQSIVRELSDEKIDVIEWDPEQKTFIAKALSPARVSQVFLEDHPTDGKTAIVVVPDDQLSLAIGREGQNARLAAKLTGWRIDIKSLTESATESLSMLDHEAVDPAIAKNTVLIDQVRQILEKKAASRPITAEDYNTMNRIVAGVEGRIIASRASRYEEMRKEQAMAREQVPPHAWNIAIDELGLSDRVYDLLYDNEVQTVGAVLYRLALGMETLLTISGFGDKALEELREMVDEFEMPPAPVVEEEPAESDEEAEDAVDEAPDAEVVAEGDEAPEAAVGEETAVATPEPVEAETPVVPEAAAPVEEEAPVVETAVVEDAPVVAETPPVTPPVVETKPKAKPKPKPSIVIARPTPGEEELDDTPAGQKRRKGKQLVFDEETGRVVVKRKRKGSRGRPKWEEALDEEFDLDLDLDDEF